MKSALSDTEKIVDGILSGLKDEAARADEEQYYTLEDAADSMREFAHRLDVAIERERKALMEAYDKRLDEERAEAERAGIEEGKRLARVFNEKAIRDAFFFISEYAKTARCHTEDEHVLGYLEQIEKWATNAPSEPMRNCDFYDNKTDAETRFVEETGENDMAQHYWQMFANWLFAPSAERKGEN